MLSRWHIGRSCSLAIFLLMLLSLSLFGPYASSRPAFAAMPPEQRAATGLAWVTRTPMPTPRSYMAVAVLNNKIYVAGGMNAKGITPALEVYDPGTNT